MAITRTVAEAIENAEPILKLWHRVCGELDDGKSWDDIDTGLRGPKMPQSVWAAYMRQRIYHHLNGIVLCYRHGPDATQNQSCHAIENAPQIDSEKLT